MTAENHIRLSSILFKFLFLIDLHVKRQLRHRIIYSPGILLDQLQVNPAQLVESWTLLSTSNLWS